MSALYFSFEWSHRHVHVLAPLGSHTSTAQHQALPNPAGTLLTCSTSAPNFTPVAETPPPTPNAIFHPHTCRIRLTQMQPQPSAGAVHATHKTTIRSSRAAYHCLVPRAAHHRQAGPPHPLLVHVVPPPQNHCPVDDLIEILRHHPGFVTARHRPKYATHDPPNRLRRYPSMARHGT